jgi:hypothetical protein
MNVCRTNTKLRVRGTNERSFFAGRRCNERRLFDRWTLAMHFRLKHKDDDASLSPSLLFFLPRRVLIFNGINIHFHRRQTKRKIEINILTEKNTMHIEEQWESLTSLG